MGMDLEFDRPEDLGPLIDAIAPLRREGVLQQSPTIGNWLRAAAILTTRAEWTDEKGALSDTVIAAIRKKFQMGWWGVSLRLYGRETINREAYAILESEMNKLAAQHEAHELETWRSAGNDRLDRYAAHLPDAERELARWPGRAYRLRRCYRNRAPLRWSNSAGPTSATRNSAWIIRQALRSANAT
jgi:hypothetical protein